MNGIVSAAESHQLFDHPVQLAALREHLSTAEVDTVCRQLGHTWRDRDLPPSVTVHSLVYRSLVVAGQIGNRHGNLSTEQPW